LVAAAVAATESITMNKKPQANKPQTATGVLLASLVLPGLAALGCVAPLQAAAENAPEKSTIALKYSTYNDSQPDWDRIKVSAPQVYVQVPISSEWSIEASGVVDSVSGASPRWHTQHTQLSGASRMSDERKAGDVKVTRYFGRAAVSASVALSSEHDYKSNAFGLDGRWSSEDNNRTWTAGYGHASDTIDTTDSGGSVANQHKRTHEFMAGVTQVLTPTDIAQFNLTRSVGSGYYSDPYKTLDQRPDQRNAWISLARWNHYVDKFDASVRSSYRYYSDTFGVKSHTAGVEWVQPLGRWTLAPGVRYYSQSAASFYMDPILDAQGQYDQIAVLTRAAINYGNNQSTDQRLAAFGAVTLSMKVSFAFTPDTVVDVKYETYQQKSALHFGSAGSPGLDPFNANFMQVGLTHRF
jgi:hypothetical protein